MAPKYKITYFNGAGRPEPVKLMFAYKNIQYEDVRIKSGEWEAFKPKTPYGHLPLLEIDGFVLSESYAIMRYVAKQLGLLGKNDLEAAKADEIMDFFRPCYDHPYRIETFFSKDEAKKAWLRDNNNTFTSSTTVCGLPYKQLKEKFTNEIVLSYFKKLDEIIKENGDNYIVGNDLTWADFGVAYSCEEMEIHDCSRSLIGDYPSLAKHRAKILGLPGVKEYIATRPKGDF